jgi:ribosomal protein S18 acetylase RimI-like enzyme
MNTRLVPIHELNDEQLEKLAGLHKEVVHSLLTDLGLPFLQKYYRIARMEGTVIGFCALSEADTPLGWAIGSPNPEKLNDKLKQPLSWFILQILRVAIRDPRLLWQLLLSARSASMEVEPVSVELTYLGVDSSARGIGLGRTLLEAFIQASKGQYRAVVLSVEVENTNAIQLYTTSGFQIVKTLNEGKFQRHHMKLKL